MLYRKDGFIFDSNTGNDAKYKVVYNGRTIYFGNKHYEQYHDKIGHYSDLDHYDKVRRQRYRKRHSNDFINDPNYAGYYAWRYLW